MRFLSPQSIVGALPELKRPTVVDVGCGVGHYTLPLTRYAHEVLAVDINPHVLRSLDRAKDSHKNLRLIWGDASLPGGTHIKTSSVDTALISNTLFQIGNKDAFVDEMKRILSPMGQVVVIDWENSFRGMGPHPSHVVSYSEAISLFEKHGLSLKRDLGVTTGPYHYGFVAGK